MNDWFEVFKLKQVNVGSTKLRDKKIPEDEPDDNKCCEEAAKTYYLVDLGESMAYARFLYDDNEDSIGEIGITHDELLYYERNGPSSDNMKEMQMMINLCNNVLQVEMLKTILLGRRDMDYRGHAGKSTYQKIIDDWKACEKW